MDLGTVIIGALLFAICIVPFILMSRSSKKGEKMLFQSLVKNANEHSSQIQQHGFCGNFAIGIDEINKKVFFAKQANSILENQFVDLSDIKLCTVISDVRTEQTQGKKWQVVDKIELCFIPLGRNGVETRLEFYNSQDSLQLSGEQPFMVHWEKQINALIKAKK